MRELTVDLYSNRVKPIHVSIPSSKAHLSVFRDISDSHRRPLTPIVPHCQTSNEMHSLQS